MGKLFNDRTEVLFQNPSFPKGYYENRKSEICLLLPMCAYKVLVPYPKDNSLNLFQETILKLFLGGNKSNEEIAEKLSLNVSLVEFIVKELINRELINNRRSLTYKGHALLNNDDDNYELKIGYVFYNYLTKTYMDAFISDEEFRSVAISTRRGNKIQFFVDESVSNPRPENAIIVHADNEENIIEPEPQDIIGVCKKSNRRKQMLIPDEMNETNSLTDKKNKQSSQLPKNIEKVSFLKEYRYVYVATYIALSSDDIINKSKIQMCYPFGVGFASNILETVLELSNNKINSDVKNAITNLGEKVYGMTEKEIENTKKEKEEITNTIRKILTGNIENYPHIYIMLQEVESNYVLIETLLTKNTGSNYKFIQNKINDYITGNYNLIAGILIEVAQKYNDYNGGMLTNRLNLNSITLSELARQMGFSDDENIFGKFFALKKGSINNACRESHVKALMAYNLIIANRTNGHPFYNLSKQVPQFITYLNKLTELRNEGKHGNALEYDFNTIKAYSKKNMYIASLLLDGLGFNNDERNFDFNNDRLIDPNRIKVAKLAKIQVEKIYTPNAKKYGTVLEKLVSLQEEIILNGEEYPGRVSDVLEAIFKHICQNRIRDNALPGLKDFKDNNANAFYLQKMQEYGFDVKSIPYYDLAKLTKTFKNYHNGTLGTLFYAWFFSEDMNDNTVLSKIALKAPYLVQVIGVVISTRGHSGKKDFKSEELDFLKKYVDEAINALIDLMTEMGL